MSEVRTIGISELEKIRDALADANDFFKRRDEMNAAVHLAKATRYSPLTSIVERELFRLTDIIGRPGGES